MLYASRIDMHEVTMNALGIKKYQSILCGHTHVVFVNHSYTMLIYGPQGPAREKEKREKERSELRDLVIISNLGPCGVYFT